MLRKLHAIPGLLLALLLVVVAASGAALSVFPALERAQVASSAEPDVATLAGRVAARLPGVETLVRQPSGTIVAYHLAGQEQQVSIIDPATGAAIAPYRAPASHRWLKNLHRKLLLGDAGRVAAGVAAAGMLLVAVSGLLLLARRMGGFRRIFAPVRGTPLQKLHDETARVALAGLLLSGLTGLLMSLSTFGFLPEGGAMEPLPDTRAPSATTVPLARMPALQGVALAQLRQLKLANPGDRTDVIELETTAGSGVVDPSTGKWVAFAPLDGWQRTQAAMRMLHTGEGLWWLGLLLGASSLSVPLLGATGILLWLQRRRALPRLAHNVPAQEADTVLLVGSEGGTTWGFAMALHDALARAGVRVHTASMNDLAPRYRKAQRLLVLAATHGDGDAPESARLFLRRLAKAPAGEGLPFAVLGFGDRQFPQFCGYAQQVHEALAAKGFTPLRAAGTVDRQSEPEFRRWCTELGTAIGVALDIRYTPLLPPTTALQLVSRTDYEGGAEALTAVLRFAPVAARGRRAGRLPDFETGDLLGVVPPGGGAPRYYSLASGAQDGVAEICVRRHPGGLCSGYLTALRPGDTIEAFVRPHERFRPAAGAAPVVLVGAGTGIGPLVGFVRNNPPQRPMHLYFGARDAGDGFLYGEELQGLVESRHLHSLHTAFSRAQDKAYVQDRLRADAPRLRQLIAQGGQVLVCGGRRMAEGVAATLEGVLAGTGTSLAQLKAEGRYVEDVY